MNTRLLLASVLALGLTGAVAHAQVPTYNVGDLIVGFQEAGAANSLEIDLGSASQLTQSIDFGNVGAALASDFGSVSNASWSVGAAVGGANGGGSIVSGGTSYLPRTFWVTDPQGSGTPTPVNFNGASSINTAVGTIGVNLQGSPNLGTGILAGAANISSAASFSYAMQEPNYGLTTFGITSPEQTGSGALNLYSFESLTPGVAGKGGTTQSDLLPTLDGTFSLSSAGELSFTAIPEPSSYAAILGALTIGCVALRRRFVQAGA